MTDRWTEFGVFGIFPKQNAGHGALCDSLLQLTAEPGIRCQVPVWPKDAWRNTDVLIESWCVKRWGGGSCNPNLNGTSMRSTIFIQKYNSQLIFFPEGKLGIPKGDFIDSPWFTHGEGFDVVNMLVWPLNVLTFATSNGLAAAICKLTTLQSGFKDAQLWRMVGYYMDLSPRTWIKMQDNSVNRLE